MIEKFYKGFEMAKEFLKKQAILPRIDGIQRDIEKLRKLSALPLEDFSTEDNFIKAQFYLRRALEGVFHIGAHILARIPGGRVTEYKSIARKLSEVGIIPKSFAERKLTAMAGYRNRLTHFYADSTPNEIHIILHTHLDDFDTYLRAVKNIISSPNKYDLALE